jgi:hypothetical protein
MEGTVKARLLLTNALFLFVQIPAQAQVTVDVAKITCERLSMEQLPFTRGILFCGLAGITTANTTTRSSNPAQLKGITTTWTDIATDTATRRSWMPSRTWDWANDAAHALALMPSTRRFPPSWTVEKQDMTRCAALLLIGQKERAAPVMGGPSSLIQGDPSQENKRMLASVAFSSMPFL